VELLGSELPVLNFIEEYNTKRFKNTGKWVNNSHASGKGKTKKPRNQEILKKIELVGCASPGASGMAICECMATVHELVSNCLVCGKIVCSAEIHSDIYICPFCASPFSISNYEFNEATAHRDTLLEYDRNSTARTHVNDQASDFNGAQYDKWKSEEEKQEIRDAIIKQQEMEEYQNKRNIITLDLENKTIICENAKPIEPPPSKIQHKPASIEKDISRPFRNFNLDKKAMAFQYSKSEVIKNGKPLIVAASNRLQDDYDAI
jgi:hypothetical protein